MATVGVEEPTDYFTKEVELIQQLSLTALKNALGTRYHFHST
ncbi:MAG: hypothetical protein R2825_20425 [Saprospiraceae bacterium]